jgi:competence protein ComEA
MKYITTLFKLILSTILCFGVIQVSYAADDTAESNVVDMVEFTVNVNQASADEMATLLKGVGAKKALAIIQYREQHGPFTDIAQLTNVKGLGPSFIEKNRAHLSIK